MVRADGLDEGRPVAFAVRLQADMDARPQQRQVGDLEPLQQQRQQPQVRGEHVDMERGIAGAATLQADVMEGDVARRQHRNVDRAVDAELEPGDDADLRFHRLAQRVAVDEPGSRDQGDQRAAEQRRDRRPEALYSLGHGQWHVLIGLVVGARRAGR
ncbi:hypothetical protein ACVWW5_001736 [Bradyrhizobium sp. LM3.4]